MDTLGVAIILLLYGFVLVNAFASWYAFYIYWSAASLTASCITTGLAFIGTWVLFGDTA